MMLSPDWKPNDDWWGSEITYEETEVSTEK